MGCTQCCREVWLRHRKCNGIGLDELFNENLPVTEMMNTLFFLYISHNKIGRKLAIN